MDRFESRNMTVVPPTAAAASVARARHRFSRPTVAPSHIITETTPHIAMSIVSQSEQNVALSVPSLPLLLLLFLNRHSVIPANDTTLCHCTEVVSNFHMCDETYS